MLSRPAVDVNSRPQCSTSPGKLPIWIHSTRIHPAACLWFQYVTSSLTDLHCLCSLPSRPFLTSPRSVQWSQRHRWPSVGWTRCLAQWGDFNGMPVTVIYWLLSGYISTSERQLLLMTLWDSCLKLRHYFTNSYSNNCLRPGGREHIFLYFAKPIEGSWEIAWHQVVKALAEATEVAGLLTIQWSILLMTNCWKLVYIWLYPILFAVLRAKENGLSNICALNV